MKDEFVILTTRISATIGSIGLGGIGAMNVLELSDLVLGVVLKAVSVLSFIIVIVINIPKFNKTIRIGYKKLLNKK